MSGISKMRKTIFDAINTHKESVALFEESGAEVVLTAAEIIINCFNNHGCLYLCGNGGSAADCQHIAGEFTGRFRLERRALPAVALCTDTSVMTCIGNDYSLRDIFSRQVKALVNPDDVLWALSTSGESPNILSAAMSAREKGVKVISFTGKPESELERISHCCLCAMTSITSTAQEIHQIAYHIICELVEQYFV
jgi:D-sedoheptulose 7-phosphate isomerase